MDEISKLKEILFRIYLVGNPKSYTYLEKLVKEIEQCYEERFQRTEDGKVQVNFIITEWTEKLEDIIKYHFRNDLKFEVETKLKKLIEEVKANRALAAKAKKSGFKNNEAKIERPKGKDQTRYLLSSNTGEKKLNKSDYILELFILNFRKNKKINTYEKFLYVFTEIDGEDFWDNTMRSNAYKSSNPVWLPEKMALEKKKASKEGEGWDRYITAKEKVIVFDDNRIVVRKGQSIDDVESIEKLFKNKGLDIGKKFVPK